MRYLYKINSQYDGFRPARIQERLIDGRFLRLGWKKYLDALNEGDEVWVVFVGGKFQHGVYAQGLVAEIDSEDEAGEVLIRVRSWSADRPLVDDATSAALLHSVDVRYRQVFLWPEGQTLQENCTAADCGNRLCANCQVWLTSPRIDPLHYQPPAVLRQETVVPGYWIIPNRCYLYRNGREPAPWIRRVTEMFSAFKVGESRYAYPFARGINSALELRGEMGFDAIVPIPLSPEKEQQGELNRTLVLAEELSRLNGAPVRRLLQLSGPISKRRMLSQGYTVTDFRQRYRQLIQVDRAIAGLHRVVLVDDVITKGSTTSVAIKAMRMVNPLLEIVTAAAGQMILMEVVTDENGPAW